MIIVVLMTMLNNSKNIFKPSKHNFLRIHKIFFLPQTKTLGVNFNGFITWAQENSAQVSKESNTFWR